MAATGSNGLYPSLPSPSASGAASPSPSIEQAADEDVLRAPIVLQACSGHPLGQEEAEAIQRCVAAYAADNGVLEWLPLSNHCWNTVDDPTGAVVRLRADARVQHSPFSGQWFRGNSMVEVLGPKNPRDELSPVYFADAERRRRFMTALPEQVSDPISLHNRSPDTGDDLADGSSRWTAELGQGPGHRAGVMFRLVKTDDGDEYRYFLVVRTAPRRIGEELQQMVDDAVQRGETVGELFSRPIWTQAQRQAERERARALLVLADALDVKIAVTPDMYAAPAPAGAGAAGAAFPMLAQVVSSATGNVVVAEKTAITAPTTYSYYSEAVAPETMQGGVLVFGGSLQGAVYLRGHSHLETMHGQPWAGSGKAAVVLDTGDALRLQSVPLREISLNGLDPDRRKRLQRLYGWEGVQTHQHAFHPHNMRNHSAVHQRGHDEAGHRGSEWGRYELRPQLLKLPSTPDYLRHYNA